MRRFDVGGAGGAQVGGALVVGHDHDHVRPVGRGSRSQTGPHQAREPAIKTRNALLIVLAPLTGSPGNATTVPHNRNNPHNRLSFSGRPVDLIEGSSPFGDPRRAIDRKPSQVDARAVEGEVMAGQKTSYSLSLRVFATIAVVPSVRLGLRPRPDRAAKNARALSRGGEAGSG